MEKNHNYFDYNSALPILNDRTTKSTCDFFQGCFEGFLGSQYDIQNRKWDHPK